MMTQWLAIALGGALGSVARYAAVGFITPLSHYKFPVGTFAVNLLGSFLIGIAYVMLTEKNLLAAEWRLFFVTGLLGGFTTFSAFSLETLQLWQAGHGLNAVAYASGSVIFGVLLAFAGMMLAQRIL